MKKLIFVLVTLFALSFVSCKHDNKAQEMQESQSMEVDSFKLWKDSVAKTKQTLSFMGDTLGRPLKRKAELQISDDFRESYEEAVISVKYAADGQVEVEKNVHALYYLYNKKIYKIMVKTDNRSVFEMILDSYMNRFHYPKDENGNYLREDGEDFTSPTYSYRADFENCSFSTGAIDNSQDASPDKHDWNFMYGNIYYILFVDYNLSSAYDKHEEAKEKQLEEQERKAEKRTDSLKSALKSQFN